MFKIKLISMIKDKGKVKYFRAVKNRWKTSNRNKKLLTAVKVSIKDGVKYSLTQQ